MKNSKNKDISISDLVDEFHVSKSSIELYGIHRLLLPIPDQKSKAAYRLLDKARLKFIIRAKNADYTIGNIRDLIGAIDLEKNEADQLEESLVYGKQKAADLTERLEDLDTLERINATCDLELLEAYITDLKNLKYGLDITPIKEALPKPDKETSHAKPRTLVYSHIADQINDSVPAIAPKKSRMPLFFVAGIFLVAITAYLYLGGDLFPDISNDLAVAPPVEPIEMTSTSANTNEADEISLSETDTTPVENSDTLAKEPDSDEISLSEKNLNPDKNIGPLADEPDSTEDLLSLLDFPALKNELNSPSADPMESELETYSAKLTQNAKNTQALMDGINESGETTPKPDMPEKEETEDIFFKQLVADLKKKYDQQAEGQKPTTNDNTKTNAASEKMSEGDETQNLAALVVPNTDSQTSNTTTAKTKTSPMQTDLAPPEKVAPAPVTQTPSSIITGTSSTNAGAPKQSAPDPKPASSTIKTGSSTQQTTASTKKAKISTPPKPKAKPKAKPKTTPEPKPEPKPKIVPQKPANPEALKWAQKSYESVISGDAGEAIIAASVAITLDPNLVNAYINRSWAYSKKGLFDRAIQDCDKALNIDNDNALAYNNRGLAFQGKGDMDKAKADYDRACKLGFDLGCKNYQEVVGGMADNS